MRARRSVRRSAFDVLRSTFCVLGSACLVLGAGCLVRGAWCGVLGSKEKEGLTAEVSEVRRGRREEEFTTETRRHGEEIFQRRLWLYSTHSASREFLSAVSSVSSANSVVNLFFVPRSAFQRRTVNEERGTDRFWVLRSTFYVLRSAFWVRRSGFWIPTKNG